MSIPTSKTAQMTGALRLCSKSPRGKPNLVIHCKIVAKSNTSSFMLKGKNVTGREASLRMAELGVQVGNLSSFLRQEKVSEFAIMSSQQLLVETQKAASDPNLTNWHETLMDSGKDMKVVKEVSWSCSFPLTQLTLLYPRALLTTS
ncbi:hypothetical protein BT96DRAFT_415552 [Gymnopus androsaceus JB14]|uniref:Uncharacterized protein n=1 Tax=Gymnopus androsaceus JB14 TaxID=1447944 RepID=A0A6A4GTH8_9AGAR|nr:hypothetical protein BT96DRAFT_415552 [Gymnopus androsaceus JB14]